MTNLTDVTNQQLQALKDFANSENKQLVAKLEEILEDVAKTGQYIYPWHFMKPLYACKLDQVTSEFLTSSPPLNTDGTEDEEEVNKLKQFRDELLVMFDKFGCAPFTIQRVSELLTNPKKHYKSTAKFFRGLEKNIHVVSTVEPVPSDQRPLLKRSLHDENPISKQNGYVETELKPQLKKVHLEENSADDTINSSLDNMPDEADTKAFTESTANDDTPPSSSEGLENMLVCNELVSDPAEVNGTNGSLEEEEKIIENKKDDIPAADTGEEPKPIDQS